jgi:hypothetical protein
LLTLKQKKQRFDRIHSNLLSFDFLDDKYIVDGIQSAQACKLKFFDQYDEKYILDIHEEVRGCDLKFFNPDDEKFIFCTYKKPCDINPDWSDLRQFEKKLYQHIKLSEEFFSLADFHKKNANKNQVAEINKKLRDLRQQLKWKRHPSLFLEIKRLIQELHSLASINLKEQKRRVKGIRKIVFRTFKEDIRFKIRSIVRFLFKYLNDFSGCDEEEVVGYLLVSSNNFFITPIRILCSIKKISLNQ